MTTKSAQVDLSDPRHFDQGIPHEHFESLRAQAGLTWNAMEDGGDGFWSVTRYQEVVEVSRKPAIFSSALGHIQIYNIDADALDVRASMIDMDPPAHARLRRLVARAFLPNTLQAHQHAIAARINKTLEELCAGGGGDWVRQVSKPIPIGVICDILGVPASDHELMIELTDHLVAGTSSLPLAPDAYGNTTPLRLLPFNSPAAHGLREYADRLGAARRGQPAADLVTLLVNAEIEGEKLTAEEFSNFFRLLVFAGNETTRSAISHLALLMEQQPQAFAILREVPELIDTVVEEVVRLASPILYFRRTATRDTTLAGTRIEAGQRVVMWYASANFDARQFNKPRLLDPRRQRPRVHAGFGGGGIHICLGAWLARLELKLLISELVRRRIRLTTTTPPIYVNSNFVNGIEKLQVDVQTH